MAEFIITFVKEATVLNKYFLYHAVFGLILGRFWWWIFKSDPEQKKKMLIAVLICAVLFEIMEAVTGISGYSWGIKGYIADTSGDIIIAVLMAWTLTR